LTQHVASPTSVVQKINYVHINLTYVIKHPLKQINADFHTQNTTT